jgi:hypothetical protein
LIRLLIISLSLFLIVYSCINHSHNDLTTKKVTIEGREMLYGNIDREQLYFDYPDWEKVEKEYEPSSEIVNQINKYIDSLSVDIFLGTWCSDSKREVPAFFRIIDQADIANKININIWALDRNKKLDNGLAEKCSIEYVPTFIFYKSNHEIGRIVEMPDGLLEEDILKIIQSSYEKM